MATLMRYEPWALHRDLINEVNRFFERAVGADESSGATAEWAPAVDIEEYADKFVLYADVPGVDPKAIEVTLENGVLTLSGTREKTVNQNGVEAMRTERASGRFFRRFSLPDTVDAEAVSAKGANGVLEIVIPKRPAAQPRKITVTQ
ncbi:MAG: Hsp20/alpha crystallin family protein [Sinobacteraceae bacterium]|nr:Hsp20/alpha crystallin family protein [Nevskia sp.]MDI3259173.1 Hsp20/alpha crystallin family protein [Nevskiaceae bacterium]